MAVAFALHKDLTQAGEMTSEEMALWEAWLKTNDPERRYDRRFGRLCSAVFATRGIDLSEEDCMLFISQNKNTDELLSEEQFIRDVAAYAASRGNPVKPSQGKGS